MTSPAGLQPIWTPPPERVQASQMYRWMQALQAKHGFPLAGATDYAGFHRWSVEHVAEFWGEVWADAGIAASRAASGVLTDAAMPPDR
ncbi:MAG: acetoacetate--CoA ligase, partial [SAR324 cluster bacterium]